jgi:hypothetical protein
MRAFQQLGPDRVLAVQVQIADGGFGQLRLCRGLILLAAVLRFVLGLIEPLCLLLTRPL